MSVCFDSVCPHCNRLDTFELTYAPYGGQNPNGLPWTHCENCLQTFWVLVCGSCHRLQIYGHNTPYLDCCGYRYRRPEGKLSPYKRIAPTTWVDLFTPWFR